MSQTNSGPAPKLLTLFEFSENARDFAAEIRRSDRPGAITNNGQFVALISPPEESPASTATRCMARQEFLDDPAGSLQLVKQDSDPIVITDDDGAWLQFKALSDEELMATVLESPGMAERRQAALTGQTRTMDEVMIALTQR